MKISDVEIGAVYRYTYGGPAAGSMNSRGPWLVGKVAGTMGAGHLAIDPVHGLPVARSRPPAGAQLATTPTWSQVHVTRIGGRLCHADNWDEWVEVLNRQAAEAEAARVAREAEVRDATVAMVASLELLGCDVGAGAWDRSTRWGQFVDDLRRREHDVIGLVSEALQALADPGTGEGWADAMASAEHWLTAPITTTKENDR